MSAYARGFLGFLAGFAASLGVTPAAMATTPFSLPVSNQAALARGHALPVPEAAAGDEGARLQLDWTSEFLLEEAGNETIELDGETLRLAWTQRWVWNDWRLSAELPLLVTGGGTLDSGIEQWHDWFSLPNGRREERERDQYRYAYTRGGATVFDVRDSGAGLGDLRLGAARCSEELRCLRAMLQLPTGDADRFEGGGLGGALWYERGFRLGEDERWTGTWAAGASATRADGPLEAQAETIVPFGWVGVAYGLTERLDAGAQVYLHGPLYDDSALDALSRAGGQLAFGFAYTVDERLRWTAALQEDIVTASSPDFSIHLGVEWR